MTRHFSSLLLLLGLSSAADAQWTQTSGPKGADVTCLTTVGSNLLAAVGSEVYRSIDSGSHWIKSSDGLSGDQITKLGSVDGYLFAGTTHNGVFRSGDSGRSWQQAIWGLKDPEVTGIGSIGTITLLGTSKGLYRSSDHGSHWNLADSMMKRVSTFATMGNFLFCGTMYQVGPWVSTDTGSTWTKTWDSNFHGAPVTLLVVDSILMAGSEEGFFRSTDSARSWSYLQPFQLVSSHALASIGNYVFTASWPTGLYRSTDLGAYWGGNGGGRVSFSFISDIVTLGNVVFIATPGFGIFRSIDSGETWIEANEGLIVNVRVTGLIASDPYVLASIETESTWRTSDAGQTWSNAAINIPINSVDYLSSFGKYIYCTNRLGIFRSSDNGKRWRLMNAGTPERCDVFAMCSSGNRLFAALYGLDIYHSNDSGATWSDSSSGLPDKRVHALAAHGAVLLAGTDSLGMLRSMDDGRTWTKTNAGLNRSRILAALVDGANIFVGTDSGGIYRSNDDAATWTHASSELPSNATVLSFAVHDRFIFAGTASGELYRTMDNGATWQQVSTGLPGDSVSCLAVSGTNLFAGTKGQAVWRRPLAEMENAAGVYNETITQPQLTCTPNPLSHHTSIQLSLAHTELIQLTIRNMLGQVVSDLFHGQLRPGVHKFPWTTADIPPGAYECVAQFGGRAEYVRIMVLN